MSLLYRSTHSFFQCVISFPYTTSVSVCQMFSFHTNGYHKGTQAVPVTPKFPYQMSVYQNELEIIKIIHE